MKNQDESHLIFSELLNCYSPYNSDFGELFVKHLSHFESIKIEKQYIYSLQDAKSKNLLTNSDKQKTLIKEGHWTDKEETKINDTIKFITSMRETISKEFLLSKRRLLRREVADAEKRLNAILMKKDFLMGLTAEKYARQQSIHNQIVNSFYKNESLTEKFSEDDMQDEDIYNKLIEIYNRHNDRININMIKNIAVSSFFTNLFYMCGDNAYYFYGKPIVQLTNYQTDLFSYGRYFKNLMGQYGDKLPKEMSDNPDDMIEFFEISRNVESSGILKEDENGNGGSTSIMGATKEDLTVMGVDTSQIRTVADDMKKLGKSHLTKEDLMKLRG